jgi:hypothetical protein
MKKIILFSILISSFLITSCKKTDTPAPAKTTSSPTPYGFLTASKSYSLNSGSLVFSGNYAYAEFRSDLSNISTDMQIGSVSVGGKYLKYNSVNKLYQDTTNTLSVIPTTWQVAGSNPIPSFTYTNNDSLPVYTGYTSLPDTIYKNQNLALQINGITGADEIEVSFYSTSGPLNLIKVKSTGVVTNNTITYSSSELSPLSPGSSAITLLNISIFKHNYQAIGGVSFSFATQLGISKQVYIK